MSHKGGLGIRASDDTAPAFIRDLREARVDQGLTQQDLAAQLGWPTARIQRYESGSVPIHPRVLAQWAAELGRQVRAVPILRQREPDPELQEN